MKIRVRLKQQFVDRIAVHLNVANTPIPPHGQPQHVTEEVRRRIGSLAPVGRYVFSGGHNVQGDVPRASLIALFDTDYEVGTCPLNGRS